MLQRACLQLRPRTVFCSRPKECSLASVEVGYAPKCVFSQGLALMIAGRGLLIAAPAMTYVRQDEGARDGVLARLGNGESMNFESNVQFIFFVNMFLERFTMKSFFALMLVLCGGVAASAVETGPGANTAFGSNSVSAIYYADTGNLWVSTGPTGGTGAINFYVESSTGGETPLPVNLANDTAALGGSGDATLVPGFASLPAASQGVMIARMDLGVTVALSNNVNRRGVGGLGKTQNFQLGSIGAGLPVGTLRLFYQTATGAANERSIQFSTVPGSQAYYAAVPEPASIGMVGLGLAGLLAARRRG